MSNSPLISYVDLSPNNSGARNHEIDTISIHCMAGNLSVESCGRLFARTSTSASSNYGIGSDGRIAMYVEEKNRSWCTSSKSNDNRATTIEVANDGGAPDWHVSDAALASLIKLCADICTRNNIDSLLWKGDKSLIGQVDKQNMTVHRWFKNKACPGNYLYSLHGYIADQVNAVLHPVVSQPNLDPVPDVPNTSSQLYRVRTSWAAASSQKGAFASLAGAKKVVDGNSGYKVFDWDGNQVYPEPQSTSAFPNCPFKVAVKVPDLRYRQGPSMSSAIKGVTGVSTFTIVEVNNGWGRLKGGAGWIWLGNANYCSIVGATQSATPARPTLKSNTAIAKEVIAGKWGIGAARKQKLTAAGYDYDTIRALVNKMI